MRAAARAALALLGLAIAAYGVSRIGPPQVVSAPGSEAPPAVDLAPPSPPGGDDALLREGSLTVDRTFEEIVVPWHAIALIVSGLALTGYALFGARRRSLGGSALPT